MDDRKILSFFTVLEEGSINAAAERLHGTQSGVTQSMNALETELGVKLLKRSNKGVSLTEAGEQLLPLLTALERDFQKLERRAREIADGKGGIIRIGTYSSIANTWLPDIISKYESLHPEYGFEILVGSDKLSRWLARGKVDMLLVDESIGNAFTWYPIMKDEFLAAVPASFPIAEKKEVTEVELYHHPIILGMLNTYRRLREIPEELPDGKIPKVIRVGADDDMTIIRMISKELGVSIMAGLSLQQEIPENVRTIPLTPPVYRIIGAALPSDPMKAAKDFTRFLIENERQLL